MFKIKQLFIFSIIILIYNTPINAQKTEDVVFYSHKYYFSNIAINFQQNRFCYFGLSLYSGVSDVYSKGSFIKKDDTLFLKTDYSHYNLPLHILEKNDKLLNGNMLIFNLSDEERDSISLKFSVRRFLFVVINNSDTLSLLGDTIKYLNKIDSFYIFNNNSMYGDHEYKTETYKNTNNNFFIVDIDNSLYSRIKELTGYIIVKRNKIIWYKKDDVVLMKKRTLQQLINTIGDHIVYDCCGCWRNEKMNFEKDKL